MMLDDEDCETDQLLLHNNEDDDEDQQFKVKTLQNSKKTHRKYDQLPSTNSNFKNLQSFCHVNNLLIKIIQNKLFIIIIILLIFGIYLNFTILPSVTSSWNFTNLTTTPSSMAATTQTTATLFEYIDNYEQTKNISKFHQKLPSSSPPPPTLLLSPPPIGYLVWSDKCKMPNVDTYDPDTMKHFKRQKYTECKKQKPITNLYFHNDTKKYILNLNSNSNHTINNKNNTENSSLLLDCCYQAIERNSKGKNADKTIKLSKCLNFTQSTQIPNTTDNILVKCKSQDKQVYINGYPMIAERHEIREKLKSWKKKNTKRPVSILMIGIDSISRVNLIRAMPKTAQLLYDTDWFEMSGYNKMDDNTFPNLMAILTGYNQTTAYSVCEPKKLRGLDKCPIIWKTFRDNGYVTAYAEDEASISTFNYLKLGFEKPPVDYYFRPFLLAAHKNLPISKKSGLSFCLGYQHSAEYIYDYAFELAARYKNEPYFGLFWTNTFSHNAISDCSSMDVRMLEYVEKLSSSGILNESVVIFFSDHGMRFGPTRKFLSGHLEERLPFMFIWLPPWLKNEHPEFVTSLKANKNRLTNPYDIHMTLKHLLELSGRVSNLPKAPDCPNCQTLLKPVPQSRSCEEIGITDHWCTCMSFENVSITSEPVKQISQYIINYLNEYIQNYKNGSFSHICGKINSTNIITAYKSNLIGHDYIENLEEYTIVMQTIPGDAIFETTVRRKPKSGKIELMGSISRLNLYATDSKCISEDALKKYCHCLKKH